MKDVGRMKQKLLLSCLFIPFLLVACSGLGMQMKGEREKSEYYAAEEPAPSSLDSESDALEVHGGGRAGLMKAKKAERPAADKDRSGSRDSETGNQTEVEDESVIIYEADCSVSVKSVKDSVKVVTDLSREFGGYIDGSTSSDSYRSAIVVVRVSSKKFDSFLNALSRVGEVESREVRATNVSDEYRDLSARLVTSQKILERLNALLQKEVDMQARIAILREIDRVTAQIESYKARIAYLKGLADYATVRVNLKAESRTAVRRYIPSPFAWIRGLNPESRSVTRKSVIAFPPPEGFFALDDDFNSRNGLYLYTLPGDTAGIRTGSVELYPKADMTFWKDAFEYDASNRLYKIVDKKEITAEGVSFALYHCRVAAGKYYSVAFTVSGADIVVVEALYRDEDSYKANKDRIERFVSHGGKK